MKKLLTSVLIFLLPLSYCFSQCKKNIRLLSDTTAFIDASGNLLNSKQEDVLVEITDSAVDIKISENGMQRDNMVGKIHVVSCQWKVPFKTGKTVMHSKLRDKGGDSKDAVLTIEGIAGKITFLLEPQESNKRIRLSIKKFEEKK
jgi:hypothetical protein